MKVSLNIEIYIYTHYDLYYNQYRAKPSGVWWQTEFVPHKQDLIKIVTSCNTHMTFWHILARSKSVTPPHHTPCTSSTLELINPWSTTITASHQLLRFLEFSSMLKLGYHQYHPQYYCLKLSPSSSSSSYSCSCSCPVFQHSIPVFPLLYTSLSCVPICVPIFSHS